MTRRAEAIERAEVEADRPGRPRPAIPGAHAAAASAVRHVRRFDPVDRAMHVTLMVSFLGLAATGTPLLFSHTAWAPVLARLLGGFTAAGTLHRLFATLLIGVFAAHVARIARRLFVEKDAGVLWGPRSMVPQPRDLVEMAQHVRWFAGLGPRPRFDHFTYWEKFDYWAVFWGMGIIGGSGLLLWFPELFARLLPGWVFNVALLVHGEEALLAVGFIFTVHFFNSHLRPEKFPMDMVIFTGSVTEEELRHERPAEFERLERNGALGRLVTGAPTPLAQTGGRIVGTAAVLIGLSIVALIVIAVAAY
jgi:cytochrome b subunit of formate dehydrogenase